MMAGSAASECRTSPALQAGHTGQLRHLRLTPWVCRNLFDAPFTFCSAREHTGARGSGRRVAARARLSAPFAGAGAHSHQQARRPAPLTGRLRLIWQQPEDGYAVLRAHEHLAVGDRRGDVLVTGAELIAAVCRLRAVVELVREITRLVRVQHRRV